MPEARSPSAACADGPGDDRVQDVHAVGRERLVQQPPVRDLRCVDDRAAGTVGARPDRGAAGREQQRAAAGDPALAALVEELSADADFRALWERHDVRAVRGAAKFVVHPDAGPMTLSRQVLSLPDADGQVLVAYYAEPGSPSAAALASLA